MKYVVR